MPSYKLIYFNVKGRAEPTRLIFAAAGVKYEDCRIDGEAFQKLKADGKLPFGQLPVLEVDGKTVAQSITIMTYVAREAGLSPDDSFGVARADMIVEGIRDVLQKAMKFFFEKDEETKKNLTKTFYEKDLPDALGCFEKLLKSSDAKFFAGGKMSYADIFFFGSVDMLFRDVKEDIPPALDAFPLLKDLYGRVKSNPGIADWLKKRPATER